ncbi:MAG: hypothetical protein KGL00_06100 [Gammaproteobacteria bacterium]|nr:hypothetical protein [Gammaproteobacteria bacterium]MDE2023317.1 hypothetical protein [Gammaproteobacteria bacterium]MDE2273752.1 hypothetical protein [Gammaproteobacteria bacterium]
MTSNPSITLSKLIVVLLSTLVISCSAYQIAEFNDKTTSTAFDLHAISIVSGRDKYNVASYSHIGRRAKKYLEAADTKWVTIEQGEYKGWRWQFEAEPSVVSAVSPFTQPMTLKQRLTDGNAVILPSLAQMMQRFRVVAGALIGTELPSLDYRVTFILPEVNAKRFVEHHSNISIVLDYYLPAPELRDKSPVDPTDWINSIVDLGAHEFLHAYVETSAEHHLPNGFTEEVTAYTFQHCVQLYVLGTGSGLRFLDASGHDMVPAGSLTGNLGEAYLKSSATISLDARTFSLYNIVRILDKGTIYPTDTKAKQMLYGLCYAMIHHPVDLTKGYYPVNLVKPLPL